MKVRALIFDVYGTLLEIGPARTDAANGWEHLFREFLHIAPPMSSSEFADRCAQQIADQHALARSRGVVCPEIVWPEVVSLVIPGIGELPRDVRDEFVYRERQLRRSVSLHPDAALLLSQLHASGCLLGIASNAQAYTVRELQEALATRNLSWPGFFERDLCFWSFEHGFSKPNPHVFQILTARLQARSVRPQEVMMIGDRLDNDVQPAAAHGWQTWWLSETATDDHRGGWKRLRASLPLEE